MMDVSLVLGGSLKSNLRKVSVYTVSASNFSSCLLYLPEYRMY